MALKPHGKTCQIKEQIIEDQATGLTLRFSSPYGGKFGWVANSQSMAALSSVIVISSLAITEPTMGVALLQRAYAAPIG